MIFFNKLCLINNKQNWLGLLITFAEFAAFISYINRTNICSNMGHNIRGEQQLWHCRTAVAFWMHYCQKAYGTDSLLLFSSVSFRRPFKRQPLLGLGQLPWRGLLLLTVVCCWLLLFVAVCCCLLPFAAACCRLEHNACCAVSTLGW